MSALFIQLIACFLRVSVVAAAALGCVALAGRRRPAARASISATALIAILLLTAFAAIPLPAWIGWKIPANFTVNATTSIEGEESLTDQASPAQASSFSAETSHAIETGVRLTALARLLETSTSGAVLGSFELSRWLIVVAIFVGVALGGLHLVWSLARTLRLGQESHALNNPDVHRLVSEVLRQVDCAIPISIRESPALASAATIGWLRPIILLPVEWREWSRDELRAVLAHEIAHIVRRDFVMRCAGLLTRAIHFYHPLVRLLTRRLVLNQEHAADELAAPVAGGQRAYLCALSRLALRNDDRSRPASAARLLPVFSSFLIRRIEMLQEMDRPGQRSAGAFAWTCGVFVVVLAIAAVGFRETSSLAAAEEAKSVAGTQPATTGSPSQSRSTFAREMIDPSAVVLPGLPADLSYARGAFAIRVAELLRRPEIARGHTEIERNWLGLWKEMFETEVAPPLALEDVVDVIGNLQLEFSIDDGEENGPVGPGNRRVQMGSNLIHIRMRKPLDWEGPKQAIPKATAERYNGIPMISILIPVLGPMPAFLFTADEKTLVIAIGVETAHAAIDTAKQPARPPAWMPHWKEVEGGLFTLLAPSPATTVFKEIDPAAMDDFPQFFKLLDASSCIAFGIDWDDQSDLAKLRSRLALGEETPTRNALELIESMLTRYKQSLGKDETEKDVVFARTAQLLNSLVISVSDEARADARAISVSGSVQLPLDALFGTSPASQPASTPVK